MSEQIVPPAEFKRGDYVQARDGSRWGRIEGPTRDPGRWWVRYSGGATVIASLANLNRFEPHPHDKAEMERRFPFPVEFTWPDQYTI